MESKNSEPFNKTRMSSVSLTEITSAIDSVQNLTIKRRYRKLIKPDENVTGGISDNSSQHWGTTTASTIDRIDDIEKTESQTRAHRSRATSVETTNSKMLETLNDMAEYFIKSTLAAEICAGQILSEAIKILNIPDNFDEIGKHDNQHFITQSNKATQTSSSKIHKDLVEIENDSNVMSQKLQAINYKSTKNTARLLKNSTYGESKTRPKYASCVKNSVGRYGVI